MRIVECEQGTPEWYAARAGIPTASEFDKILTGGGKASGQADSYANVLLAEEMAGGHVPTWGGNIWTQRGKELEDEAANWYAYEQDVELVKVGFCVADDGLSGCSPDRLIGLNGSGLLETKCPSPQVHVAYMLDPTGLRKDYFSQAQGQMFVTGRQWVDVMSYFPKLAPVIVRIDRDTTYLAKLRREMGDFHLLLQEKRQQLIKLGYMKEK